MRHSEVLSAAVLHCWLLTAGCSLLAAHHWLLTIGYSLCAILSVTLQVQSAHINPFFLRGLRPSTPLSLE